MLVAAELPTITDQLELAVQAAAGKVVLQRLLA
jgi:hypothetical protein